MELSNKFILLEQDGYKDQLRVATDFPVEGIPYAERVLRIVEAAEKDTGIHFNRPIVFQGYFPKAYRPLGVGRNGGYLHMSVGLSMETGLDERLLKAGLYHEMFHVEENKRLRNEPYNFGDRYELFTTVWDTTLHTARETLPVELRESWLEELKANAFALHCLKGDLPTHNKFMDFIYRHTREVDKNAAIANGVEATANPDKERLYAPEEVDAAFRRLFTETYHELAHTDTEKEALSERKEESAFNTSDSSGKSGGAETMGDEHAYTDVRKLIRFSKSLEDPQVFEADEHRSPKSGLTLGKPGQTGTRFP